MSIASSVRRLLQPAVLAARLLTGLERIHQPIAHRAGVFLWAGCAGSPSAQRPSAEGG